MKLILQLEAEVDIVNAAVWYDEQPKAIRQKFLQTVEVSLSAIERHPLQYQTIFGEV